MVRKCTATLAPSDEPCPVCDVVPMGKNAEHGCTGCEVYAYIRQRLRARLGEIVMQSGRRSTTKMRAEIVKAVEEIGREAEEKFL